MGKNLTFDELIAKKMQRDADREKIAEFEVGDGTLKFRKPKESELFKIIDELQAAAGTEEGQRAGDKLIYICCPALQDDKLHKAIGAVDPYDTPALLFDIANRQKLGEKLFEFCGIVDAEEKVKN